MFSDEERDFMKREIARIADNLSPSFLADLYEGAAELQGMSAAMVAETITARRGKRATVTRPGTH